MFWVFKTAAIHRPVLPRMVKNPLKMCVHKVDRCVCSACMRGREGGRLTFCAYELVLRWNLLSGCLLVRLYFILSIGSPTLTYSGNCSRRHHEEWCTAVCHSSTRSEEKIHTARKKIQKEVLALIKICICFHTRTASCSTHYSNRGYER